MIVATLIGASRVLSFVLFIVPKFFNHHLCFIKCLYKLLLSSSPVVVYGL